MVACSTIWVRLMWALHAIQIFLLLEPSGTVSSFNYGYDNSFQQLNGQLYSVCFRREKSYCTISYKASSIGNSFSVSTTPANQKSRAGEFSCVSDFLIIPRGTNGGAGAGCYVSRSVSLYHKIFFLYLDCESQYRQYAHYHTVPESPWALLPSPT